MAIIDAAIVNLSLYLSFYLRFDGFIPGQFFTKYSNSWPEVTGICLVTFVIFNLYGRLWKFASVGRTHFNYFSNIGSHNGGACLHFYDQ